MGPTLKKEGKKCHRKYRKKKFKKERKKERMASKKERNDRRIERKKYMREKGKKCLNKHFFFFFNIHLGLSEQAVLG